MDQRSEASGRPEAPARLQPLGEAFGWGPCPRAVTDLARTEHLAVGSCAVRYTEHTFIILTVF